MVSTGGKVAIVGGAAALVGSALAWALLNRQQQQQELVALVNGSSGPVTLEYGADILNLTGSGGTPSGPAGYWQCDSPLNNPQPPDYPSPCPAYNYYQPFDAEGNFDFSTDIWVAGPDNITYWAFLDLTTGNYSNWVEVITEG